MVTLPMFPLGSVLLPGMGLPLHVFEPRYRRMAEDLRDTEAGGGAPEMGVVLIERGSEVGGGDTRTDIGTVARVVQADEMPDGQWLLAAVGLRRLRVERWLDDDPYPRAEVVDWPDEAGPEPVGPAERGDIESLVRRSAALRTELGDPAPPVDLTLDPDPAVALYQAAVAGVPGPADRQAVLAAPTLTARAGLVRDLLREQITVLEARLAAG